MPNISNKQVISPHHAKHLVEVLHYWAKSTPEHEMLRFYPQGEVKEDYESRSFSTFYSRAQTIADSLQGKQGTRAILFYQSGINFLEALFACFIAGVTAVPAYPPRRNQNFARITALIEDCSPSLILSSQAVQEQSEALVREKCPLSAAWVNTDQVTQNLNADSIPNIPEQSPIINPDDIAFLQYTSGSTGKPKGVMVSHKNLISNIRMAESNFALPNDTRCISWLPLFHDMGLIGAVMMPLYWGAGSWLMPPAAFLQKPARWFELINEACKTSHVASAAPNFSYQMCIDNINPSEKKHLRLDNWVFALNGAEPIRSETINDFIQTFSALGFQESAMGPSYGMAECTLLATTRKKEAIHQHHFDAMQLSQDLLEIVPDNANGSSLNLNSSGSSCSGQELLIVKDGEIQEDGHVGEIWLKGEHIAQGYWQQEDLSKEVFQGFTKTGKGPFLKTGDRGALINNELYITGRIKDMIIIRGRNLYPQDIEYTASHAHASFNTDNAAAFTLQTEQGDALALVQEISRHGKKDFDAEAASMAIRKAIAKEHGVEIKHIAFIRFASMPKTSSGKIQRQHCKKLYLEDGLTLQAKWSAESESKENFIAVKAELPQLESFIKQSSTEEGHNLNNTLLCEYLQQSIANKLKVTADKIPTDDALDETGLDSIDIIHLASEIEVWGGCRLDHSLFFEAEHLTSLSQQLQLSVTEQYSNQQSLNTDDQSDVEGFI